MQSVGLNGDSISKKQKGLRTQVLLLFYWVVHRETVGGSRLNSRIKCAILSEDFVIV